MTTSDARKVSIERLAKSMRMTTEEVLRPTGLMVPALGRAFDTVAWDELARIAMEDAGLVAAGRAEGRLVVYSSTRVQGLDHATGEIAGVRDRSGHGRHLVAPAGRGPTVVSAISPPLSATIRQRRTRHE